MPWGRKNHRTVFESVQYPFFKPVTFQSKTLRWVFSMG